MLDQHVINLNPSFRMLLTTGQGLLMKSGILVWMGQELITGDSNFRLMSKVLSVQTLFVLGWWALARCWLRHLAAPIPRQWLPYLCCNSPPPAPHTSQGVKSAVPVIFWPRFFSQSSYSQYWNPLAWPLAPRALHCFIISGFFSGEKSPPLGLLFSVTFCPHPVSDSQGTWDGCNCHAGHEEDWPIGPAPCQLYIAALHFLCLQIPRLHTCHLR